MNTLSRRIAASLSIVALAVTATGFAVAQGVTPASTAAPVAAAAAPTTPALNLRQIYDKLEAAGYRDIREIEWDDGRYEAKAQNAQGQRVKLYVNARTGDIEHSRVRH